MPDARPLRDAPARARILEQLDRSLLVEAGAGSGKTHEMAARMAAGVAAGVYRIEHMAAVTFTRKAAAELRGRFQLALERELADPSSPDPARDAAGERVARLAHALANLERFFAGTIHAFCARLLRERPVEAGVAPGFTELDDIQERLLRQESWRDFLAEARGVGDVDLGALQEAGVRMRDLAAAFETISLYEDVEFPPGDAPKPDDRPRWDEVRAFWTDLSAVMPAAIDAAATCSTQKAARRFADAWAFARDQRRTPGTLADLLEIWEFSPKVVQYCWSGNRTAARRITDGVKARHQAFLDATVAPFLSDWRRYLYRPCIALLDRARRRAEQERRRRNTLSFNDLLRLTAKVLRENGQVRRSLQAKYRWIFVDEFQDTDPLQAEIMLLLAGETGGPGGARRAFDPAAIAERRNERALFVVGDPKQSIYRFRRADIDVYNRVRRWLGGGDESGIVTLTTNFRSTPEICEFVNDAFRDRFPGAATTHKPKFAPLDAKRGAAGPARSLRTLVTDGDSSTAIRQDEAAKIARYIRAEVDAGRRSYRHFLILTRKKDGLHVYARALEALQIPLEVSGAGAFGESIEVRHLAALLSALADPQDAVALVGVLRGSLFGTSDRELFAFRQAGGWLSPFSPDAALAAAAPNVVAALESLGRWFRWTRVLPAGAALDRILEDSGYLALAAASPGGVEAGDLLHAIDRVRAAVEAGFTLAQAADALASYCALDEDEVDDSSEVESLPLEPGKSDVVRLMNLHKAKGLEAEVVFLADPLGGFKPRADVRIIRRAQDDRAIGYFEIKPDGLWSPKPIALPPDWDRLAAEELEYLEAESDRLLYVAATRARDVLVVSRSSSRRGTPAWSELEPYLRSAPALDVPDSVAPPPQVRVDLSPAAHDRAADAAAAAHVRARQPSWSATSVTAESKQFPRVTIGTDDVREDDPTRCIGEDTPSRRADAGLAWGTLIHGLLEHAMRHRHATRDDLRRLAMWLTIETPGLRVVIDQALDTVQAIAAAEFWQEARASAECQEEVPFAIRDDSADLPRVVTGTIDLVHRTGEGWRITDYKTDVDPGNSEAQRKYEEQIRWYASAWGRVTGERVAASIVRARTPRGYG